MSYITIEFPERKEISVKACDSITLEQSDVFHAVLHMPVEDRIVFASALIMTDIDLKELTVKRKMQVHDWALKIATDVMKDLIETDYKSALASLKNINPAKEYINSLRKDDTVKESKFANRLESEILARKSENWPGSDKHTHDPAAVSCDVDLNLTRENEFTKTVMGPDYSPPKVDQSPPPSPKQEMRRFG